MNTTLALRAIAVCLGALIFLNGWIGHAGVDPRELNRRLYEKKDYYGVFKDACGRDDPIVRAITGYAAWHLALLTEDVERLALRLTRDYYDNYYQRHKSILAVDAPPVTSPVAKKIKADDFWLHYAFVLKRLNMNDQALSCVARYKSTSNSPAANRLCDAVFNSASYVEEGDLLSLAKVINDYLEGDAGLQSGCLAIGQDREYRTTSWRFLLDNMHQGGNLLNSRDRRKDLHLMERMTARPGNDPASVWCIDTAAFSVLRRFFLETAVIDFRAYLATGRTDLQPVWVGSMLLDALVRLSRLDEASEVFRLYGQGPLPTGLHAMYAMSGAYLGDNGQSIPPGKVDREVIRLMNRETTRACGRLLYDGRSGDVDLATIGVDCLEAIAGDLAVPFSRHGDWLETERAFCTKTNGKALRIMDGDELDACDLLMAYIQGLEDRGWHDRAIPLMELLGSSIDDFDVKMEGPRLVAMKAWFFYRRQCPKEFNAAFFSLTRTFPPAGILDDVARLLSLPLMH
ncbi:hypothetical protein JW905_03365 [bacterium]|nr:hypothetical protein [candidate division CSSED10-310 bacterium]